MFVELANTLFEKGLLTKDIEIEVNYETVRLGGLGIVAATTCYAIDSISKNNKGVLNITGINVIDGSRCSVDVTQVVNIDGMPPARFAAVYGIHKAGQMMTVSKRRGRKPKIRT